MAEPKMFLGLPERWMDAHRFRCVNGHISTNILKSEERGDLCLGCQQSVLMTFPEDEEGNAIGAEVFAIRFEQYRKKEKAMPANPTALDLDQVRAELEHETPNYLDPAGPWKTMKRMSREEMLAILDLALRATAADAERDRLREESARKQNLIDRSQLQCLNCNTWCTKGRRFVTKDNPAGVYCSYDCAETDGEEWAQK